jgi:hypothetical protein
MLLGAMLGGDFVAAQPQPAKAEDPHQEALDILRRAIADHNRGVRPSPAARTNQPLVKPPAVAPPAPAGAPATSQTNVHARALDVLHQATGQAPAKRVPPGAESRLSEVEAKMDELLRLKEAREKAAQTNAVPSTAPKTKRQKLDELIVLFVNGKISEAEYNEQRNKIVAEPD